MHEGYIITHFDHFNSCTKILLLCFTNTNNTQSGENTNMCKLSEKNVFLVNIYLFTLFHKFEIGQRQTQPRIPSLGRTKYANI